MIFIFYIRKSRIAGRTKLGISLEYEGLILDIWEDVYVPSDDTYLLLEHLIVNPGDLLLEIGTGCGIVALSAARTAEKVIATDISPIALSCARSNIQKNQLMKKIELRQGFLFEPLRGNEQFNAIVFNAPYLPEDSKKAQEKVDWLEKAWNGGDSGRKIIDPFIMECKNYLKHGGRVQLVQSNLSDVSKSFDLFQDQNFQVKVAESKSFFFEKIVLINAILND